MYKIILFILLSINSSFLTAQTFEPFVIIDPPHPMVGDTIRVGVAHTFHPPCFDLPNMNFQGLTHIFETTNNNILLTVVQDTSSIPICNPFPVTPAPREYYDLGRLQEGVYLLDTWVIDELTPLPVPLSGFFPYVYGPTLTFEVTAPIAVEVMSFKSSILIIILLVLMTFIGVRLNFIHFNQP